MKARTGSTLIEMVVLMTAVSVILTLTAVTLHRIMRAHNKAHAMHADESSAWRLSTRLRRDLSLSEGAALEREDDLISLTLRGRSGEPVRYLFRRLRVVREQRLSGDRRSLEEFSFGGQTDWDVAVLPESRRVEVKTVTEPSARTLSLAPFQMHVVARLAYQPPEGGPR